MNIGISIDRQWLHYYVARTPTNELYRSSVRVPKNYLMLLQTIETLISNMQKLYGRHRTLGLSLAEELVSENQQLADQLKKDIHQRTSIRCTVVLHSQSATLAQSHSEKQFKNQKLLGAYLDHGCGIELVESRQLHAIQAKSYSLWAHSLLPEFDSVTDGLTPVCHCGQETCLEQFITVEGLERQYHQLVLKDMTLDNIYAQVDNCDTQSTRIYRIFLDQLARSLSKMISRYSPGYLLLFGAVSAYHSLARDLKLALVRYCRSDLIPEIVTPEQDAFIYARGASLLKKKTII